MKKSLITILLSYLALALVIFIFSRIEFQNKTTTIIFGFSITIISLIIIIILLKATRKLIKVLKYFSYLNNIPFLAIIIYLLLIQFFFLSNGVYPIMEDKQIFINQSDTTEIIIKQEHSTSSSYDWRYIKIKALGHSVRWSIPIKLENINGCWRFIDKENKKDTIANFRKGIIIK